MATHEHSRPTKKRKRNKALQITADTAHAYWMLLAEVQSWQDIDPKIIEPFSEAFGKSHPQWLIRSNPFRRVTGHTFNLYREHILRLDVAQCAAYLRIDRAAIQRWERDESPVPFAAFELLRLLSESPFFKVSSQVWDGWFIDADGCFVSPRRGKFAVTPDELNNVTNVYAELSMTKMERDNLAARVDHLEAENASLRGGQRVKEVSRELENMHAKLGELLSTMQTADVLPFPASRDTADQPVTRKAAS